MKRELVVEVQTQNELPTVATKILQFCGNEKVFCFNAQMGAGKTTLIKQLCKQLGYDGIVSSPTFPIINHYTNHQISIFHIDCYRLKDADEAIQVGMEDCIYSNNYCFIEWAEIAKKILPLNTIQVTIEITGTESRKVIVSSISE
jgi:tRNA threonylcarbamoyladenosine biosynthesis protein TsaE